MLVYISVKGLCCIMNKITFISLGGQFQQSVQYESCKVGGPSVITTTQLFNFGQ